MTSGLLDGGKLLDGLGDDVETLAELLLGDDQRRGEADDVAVSRLGKKTLALEEQAEVPGSSAISSLLINDDSVQETLSSDNLEDGGVEGLETVTEDLTKLLSLGSEVLLLHDLKGADGHSAAQGVSSVGGAVGAGLDDQHDLLAAEDAAHGVETARDGLAEGDEVGLDVGPLGAEHTASSADTGLDLVADEEDVVLGAESLDLLEVTLIGDDDTGLTLDGLADEGSGLLAVGLKNLLKIGNVVVSDGLAGGGVESANVGDIGTVVGLGLGVDGESDGGHLGILLVLCLGF